MRERPQYTRHGTYHKPCIVLALALSGAALQWAEKSNDGNALCRLSTESPTCRLQAQLRRRYYQIPQYLNYVSVSTYLGSYSYRPTVPT